MMMDEKDWAEFKRKLKGKTEIDLDLYKEPQMKRRIGNLVTRAGMNSYTEYFDNAAKAIGIVFFRFDSKETMQRLLGNIQEHIKVELQ